MFIFIKKIKLLDFSIYKYVGSLKLKLFRSIDKIVLLIECIEYLLNIHFFNNRIDMLKYGLKIEKKKLKKAHRVTFMLQKNSI